MNQFLQSNAQKATKTHTKTEGHETLGISRISTKHHIQTHSNFYANEDLFEFENEEDELSSDFSTEEQDISAPTSRDQQRNHIFTVNNGTDSRPMIELIIENNVTRMLIDSGAQDNLIDEASLRAWQNRPKLRIPKTKLFAYNSNKEIPTIGEFTALVKVNHKMHKASFRVVEGRSGKLLSFTTARDMNLVSSDQFKPDVIICGYNKVNEDFYTELMENYKEVFNYTVGRLKDFKVKLHIDKTIKPVQQPYRRVPYNLARACEDEIDKLIANKIIEEAKVPTGWISQMVVFPKEKKPGEVRITTDMRLANKAIVREKFPIPTIEEIAYDLHDADIFSELDLNKAFHQIQWEDEDSKNITAFETSKGIYRFLVLNMGVHNASEYLQKVMKQKVIKGLKGVRSIADNVIVAGKGRENHDRSLTSLCERLKELRITVSRNNCKLGVTELEFFGLRISKEGVALSQDKVAALKTAAQPATPSDLRSFLGPAVYDGSYIPNLATLADPLWKMLKERDFEWKEVHENAFQAVKQAVIQHTLSFFNPTWLTEVTVDASPVGLGAVLGQENPLK